MSEESFFALENNVKPVKENYFYKYWYINGTIRLYNIANVGGFAGFVNESISPYKNGNVWYKDSSQNQKVFEMSSDIKIISNIKLKTDTLTVAIDAANGSSWNEFWSGVADPRWVDGDVSVTYLNTYDNLCTDIFCPCIEDAFVKEKYTLNH